jgi:hypothetical protein
MNWSGTTLTAKGSPGFYNGEFGESIKQSVATGVYPRGGGYSSTMTRFDR